MWKLFIADDESKIRRGLKKIIDWESYGIQVIGEAEDGEAALDLIRKLLPDIILLDINMPFLNGLDLLRELDSLKRRFITIIISGYDEFTYAQRALEYNVFDYVLKPVSKEKIQHIICKALTNLKLSQEENYYEQWIVNQLDKNIDYLKKNFFLEWIENRISDDDVIKQIKYLDIHFGKDIGIIIVKIENKFKYNSIKNRWNDELIEYAISNILRELFKDAKRIDIFSDSSGNIILLTEISDIKLWENTNSEIANKINDYLKHNVIIEQSRTIDGILGIKKIYLKLIEKMKSESMFSPMVLETINYIKSNYYLNELYITDISDKLEVTPSYLSKILKKETGFTFIEYLTNTRIEKSIEIMKDQSIKIYDVAELVGYSNQHYFCRAFKKNMKVSPIEYKRRKQS